MGRFTGIAVALALTVGCATKSSKESRVEPSTGAGNATTETGRGRTPEKIEAPKGGAAQPVGGANPTSGESPVVPAPGGPLQQGKGSATPDNKPLDPSVGADPNSSKQQARANGLLGNTDQFDDSPIEGYVLDTPDEAIKTAIDAQKAGLGACHKTASGVLEIAITVDAKGKVKIAKISASSTLKDKATRDCVLAVLKKLSFGAGVKVTAPLRFTFN